MRKAAYIVSALAVGAVIVSYSLRAGDTKIAGGECTGCVEEKAQATAEEISVTGTLVSVKEWKANKGLCGGQTAESSAKTGDACPFSSGAAAVSAKAEKEEGGCSDAMSAASCPAAMEAKSAMAEKSGDCCAAEKSATAAVEYGIVDKDGNLYVAVATERVCNTTLGSHKNKTVKLNGIKTRFEGAPAIAGIMLEELQ